MADDKKGQAPTRSATPNASYEASYGHDHTVSEAKTADAEPAKNLTMDGIESHLYGLYLNQGKTPEEAKKLAKAQAAAMLKG